MVAFQVARDPDGNLVIIGLGDVLAGAVLPEQDSEARTLVAPSRHSRAQSVSGRCAVWACFDDP